MVALFAWASKKWCRVKKGRKIYDARMKIGSRELGCCAFKILYNTTDS
jgi:hypothetical protein